VALAVWALAVLAGGAAGGRWWRRWPIAGGHARRWPLAGSWRWWLALRAGRRWWPLGLLAPRWWRAVPALALRPGGGAAALKTVINQRFARLSCKTTLAVRFGGEKMAGPHYAFLKKKIESLFFCKSCFQNLLFFWAARAKKYFFAFVFFPVARGVCSPRNLQGLCF
jgi:hypothetical protein